MIDRTDRQIVKISTLMKAIHFFSLTRSKYLTQLTQRRSKGWPPHSLLLFLSLSLGKKCFYSVAERLYEHINPETFQTNTCMHGAGARSTLCSFILDCEINYVHAMSIKAALKLCACNIFHMSQI